MVTSTTSAPRSTQLPCMGNWKFSRYGLLLGRESERVEAQPLCFFLQLLIEHGAVLDSVVSSSFTSTPLCTSAIHQHWDCFAALLKAGAKPAAVGAKKSLFHILVVRNAPKEMVELLWEAGGSVYTRDQINTYPHEALNNKHSELLLHYWSKYFVVAVDQMYFLSCNMSL